MGEEDKKGTFERGLHAFRKGDFESAIEYLSEAVEYDENNDRAWNALGTACAKVERYADADLCFENALTLAPGNQTYLKNRITNAKHLKTPPVLPKKASGSFLDRLPLDKIPVEKPYILAGAAILVILIIVAIFFIILPFITGPPVPAGPPLILTANLSGSTIILTNNGGPEIASVTSFTWKVNDKPIGTGKPGDPGTLGVTPGSTASVPLADLASTNLSSGMNVVVIASYKDGGSLLALSTHLPPPSPDLIPTIAPVVNATPTIPPDKPQFSQGQVIHDESNGAWWMITTPPANGTYNLTQAARTPNGSFAPLGAMITTVSIKPFEQVGKLIGTASAGGTPAGLSSMLPPPVMGIPAQHPSPIYPTGDLVSTSPGSEAGMIVILGYDQVSDQYQTDTLKKYYTGEWGYRDDTVAEWYLRPVLEQQYPYRLGHIPSSDIGIGADSAPPRTPVKYNPGDIISPDIAGVDLLHVIVSYSPADDRYETDTIEEGYAGGWIRNGTPILEKRAFVERDNPYLIKHVDLSLVNSR